MEGVISITEPFFCTITMCTITSLVILVSGTWNTKFKNKFDGSDLLFLDGLYSDYNVSDVKKIQNYLISGDRVF